MKEVPFSRHLLIAFLLSVTLYVAGYWFIEGRRVTDGPWRVKFEQTSVGELQIEVRQESLHLGPVKIYLPATTNQLQKQVEVIFDTPKSVPFSVPAGQCVFQDTTFFPGTVALQIGDTPIQLLPRMLTVGANEFSWSTSEVRVGQNGNAP